LPKTHRILPFYANYTAKVVKVLPLILWHELRHYRNKRTPAGLAKSVDYFRQALRADPNFALAYAGLADSLFLNGQPESEAKGAARKAIELDATLGEPHASLAFMALVIDWDWVGLSRNSVARSSSIPIIRPPATGLRRTFKRWGDRRKPLGN